MNGIVPRLDSQLADIRLECLQLAHKLSPSIGLDAEDIVKAAATFSRFVIDGVGADFGPGLVEVLGPGEESDNLRSALVRLNEALRRATASKAFRQ